MPRPLRRAVSAGLVTLLATAGVVGLGAAAAQADSVQTFSGSLTSTDGVWERPDGCAFPDADYGDQQFDVQPFTVSETGGYTLEMTAASDEGDGYFYLYEGAFDPTQPTDNCIDYNDDGGEDVNPRIDRLLTAGATYTLVTTQYSQLVEAGTTFDYTNTVSGLAPVTTLALAPGQAEVVTPGTPVRLTVSFAAPVTGFDADDVDLDAAFGPDPEFTVSGSGAEYVIEVAPSEGYLEVDVRIDGGAAETAAGVSTLPSSVITYFVGPAVTVTPVETSIAGPPAAFDVVFDEAVEGLEAADLVVGGTAGATAVEVTGEGATYRVTVVGFANAGTVELTVPAFAANIVFGDGDGGGEGEGSTYRIPNVASNTASVTFAPPAPTVTVEQAPEQGDPTTTLPVAFDVRFSEPIDELQVSDVVLGGTAGATTVSVEAVAGDAPNTAYRVTVLDAAQAGTITVSIPAGAVTNQNLVGNTASTSVDNVVTYAPVAAPAPSAPAPTVAPAPGAGGTLPETGAEPGWLLALAAMMLVAVGAVAARRGARASR